MPMGGTAKLARWMVLAWVPGDVSARLLAARRWCLGCLSFGRRPWVLGARVVFVGLVPTRAIGRASGDVFGSGVPTCVTFRACGEQPLLGAARPGYRQRTSSGVDVVGWGAGRRVCWPSWGTSLVLGSPVFWSPFVCLSWTRTGPRLLGSYLGGWSRKSGRIRLGLPHLCDVSRIWKVIMRVLLLRVRAPRVDAGSVIRMLSPVPTELTVRVAECLGGPRNCGECPLHMFEQVY